MTVLLDYSLSKRLTFPDDEGNVQLLRWLRYGWLRRLRSLPEEAHSQLGLLASACEQDAQRALIGWNDLVVCQDSKDEQALHHKLTQPER